MGDDDIPPELTEQDQWGGWVMARPGDGWCSALDRNTLLCTIYERRPMICRDYQVGDSDCIGERLQLRVSPPPARPVSPDRGSNGIVILSDAGSQPQIPVMFQDWIESVQHIKESS